MQQLLQGLAQLTGLKDRQQMDLALVRLIGGSGLWRVSAVSLSCAVGAKNNQHWFNLGQLDTQLTKPELDAFRLDLGGLPRLGDFVHREAAILGKSVVRSGEGPCTTVFPIATHASVLELTSDTPLGADAESLINSLLQIYDNLQGLLDYGERDPLTELLNRKTFDRAFLQAAQEQGETPALDSPERRATQARSSYWLAVIDIDHFKQVNDNFGHLIGDEVLLLLAHQMRGNFRFHDQLYRFGGEEFVILMRCIDHTDTLNALERFRQRIAQHAFPQVGHITISIGFAPLREDDTPSGAFDRADKAVYYAKSHGRNQICSFTTLVAAGELIDPADDPQELDFF
jgi:diguanylate cyclase (GGDEF)-like protein